MSLNLTTFQWSLNHDRLSYLYEALQKATHNDPIIAALLIITEAELSVLKDFLSKFELFSKQVRLLAIPMLATCDNVEVYDYLLHYLAKHPESDEASIIVYSLSVSHYPGIFHMVVSRLISDNEPFVKHLKNIIFKMGFDAIKPQLFMLPQIPHEAIFRELFGPEKIDSLKKV